MSYVRRRTGYEKSTSSWREVGINQQILYEPMDFKMQEKEGRQIDSFIKLKNLHLNRLNCDKLYIFY